MAKRKVSSGNYVSEWFGMRVFPVIDEGAAWEKKLSEQQCPFLTEMERESRHCVKKEASAGVCTISSSSNDKRQDWLVCPYRAFDPHLLGACVRTIFNLGKKDEFLLVPGTRFQSEKERVNVQNSLRCGVRVFTYFSDKLGGEISLPGTGKSPEFAFDVTVVEIKSGQSELKLGEFGIIEIQTMDFHGSYREAVKNLQDAIRLHKRNFANELSKHQEWLGEGIEGPNMANVFKRIFYQLIFKFRIGVHPGCAGCVLAIPQSVWDSWQPHLAAPQMSSHDGIEFLLGPGEKSNGKNWIYVFDLAGGAKGVPSKVEIRHVISTSAEALAHYALFEAPEAAIESLLSGNVIVSAIRRRLAEYWPQASDKIK